MAGQVPAAATRRPIRQSVPSVQPALRCPYYIEDGGRCGVWRHRESTCATWFCRHERGLLGFQYWTAQRHLLRAVEQGLATLVALDLGIDQGGLDLLLSSSKTVDRVTDAAVYSAMWEPWLGREAQYFIECHRLVGAMSWQDVLTRAEGNLDGRIAEARATMKAMREAPGLPDVVRIRSLTRLGGDGRRTLIKGYSAYDPIEMSAETADTLPRVPQGTVDEIVAAHGDKGVDRPLLERLWEAGLLEGSSR
jgi:hypothetical protein